MYITQNSIARFNYKYGFRMNKINLVQNMLFTPVAKSMLLNAIIAINVNKPNLFSLLE